MPDRHRPEGDHHPSHFNTRRGNLAQELAAVRLSGASFDGDCDLGGYVISGDLDLSGALIRGSIILSGAKVNGSVKLSKPTIGGDIVLDKATGFNGDMSGATV